MTFGRSGQWDVLLEDWRTAEATLSSWFLMTFLVVEAAARTLSACSRGNNASRGSNKGQEQQERCQGRFLGPAEQLPPKTLSPSGLEPSTTGQHCLFTAITSSVTSPSPSPSIVLIINSHIECLFYTCRVVSIFLSELELIE